MQRRNKKSYPLIIGLTGSIGMGKTTVSRMFARCGVPVCDSDHIVHLLLGKNGAAVRPVAEIFPETLTQQCIDRKLLGKEVFGNKVKLGKLEAILHPMVRHAQSQFIRSMRRRGKKIVLLDIPLLFETQAERRCDIVVVVTAPHFIQVQRVLARAGMTEEKFRNIQARQMPNRKKIQFADEIIDTGVSKAISLKQIKCMIIKVNRKNIRD